MCEHQDLIECTFPVDFVFNTYKYWLLFSFPNHSFFVSLFQLQDYSKAPTAESEVKFQLSRVTLEPMLRSMAYISEQLSTPANRVAVINLKVFGSS